VAAFSIQDGGTPNHVHVRNNLFVAEGGAAVISVTRSGTDFRLEGNDYWSGGDPLVIEWGDQVYSALDGPDGLRKGTGEELVNGAVVGSSFDPKVANIGDAGTIENSDTLPSQLSPYRLQPSAPADNAGLNLASFGVTWDPGRAEPAWRKSSAPAICFFADVTYPSNSR
jgi:hypothetical protein